LVTSRMFPFITRTWNPLGGKCKHNCVYCWAQKLAADRKMAKYQGEPRLIEREMQRQFKADDFVFVCDMLDLFGEWVPRELIKAVLKKISKSPAKFLLLTKNPGRYLEFVDALPRNAMLGCTVETDWIDGSYSEFSSAHHPSYRLSSMIELADKVSNELFFSVEPIMEFSVGFFASLVAAEPRAVAIGYDNYDNKLPEPSLTKTLQLIDSLEKAGITVYRKTLREAWNNAW
jgi:DNA repair photolyase